MHFHLLHHVGAMDFHRLLDGAEVAGDLFVQFAGNDIFEHFALTRCERGQARADFGKFGLLPSKARFFSIATRTAASRSSSFTGLVRKSASAVFHRLDALWNITLTGQKNNGQETACFGQDALEFETIEGRHSEIEHETAHCSVGSYCARNSSADANAATAKPAACNRREMDLRTGA